MSDKTQKSKKYKVTPKQQRKVVDFAVANECVIHPLGMEYYVEGFNEFKHCVCDAKRLECPCLEAVSEVKEKGHCLCHLFWKSYQEYVKVKLGGN